MLRHKKSTHSDIDSDEDRMSDISLKEDIFEAIDENDSNQSDEHDDDMSVSSEESLDIDPWEDIVGETFQRCQSQYDDEVNELMHEDKGISDEKARENVFNDMKSTYRKAMINIFGSKLLWFDAMKKDPIFKTIKMTVNRLITKENYEAEEALKYAILKRRFLFDKVLDTYDEVPQINEEDETEQKE